MVLKTAFMEQREPTILSTFLPPPPPPPLPSPLAAPSDGFFRHSCGTILLRRYPHLGGIRRPSPAHSPSLASSVSLSSRSSSSPPSLPRPSLFPSPLLLARTAAAAASEMSSPPSAPAGCSWMDPEAAAAAEPPLDPAFASGRGVSGFGTAGRSCLRTRSGDSTVDDVTCRERRWIGLRQKAASEIEFSRNAVCVCVSRDRDHGARCLSWCRCGGSQRTRSTGKTRTALHRQDGTMWGWLHQKGPPPRKTLSTCGTDITTSSRDSSRNY